MLLYKQILFYCNILSRNGREHAILQKHFSRFIKIFVVSLSLVFIVHESLID